MIGRPRRARAPFWFECVVGLVLALAWRAWAPASHDPLAPQLAFWQIFLLIAGWVWRGVEAAGKVTLAAVAYSVKILWTFAQSILNGAQQVARGVREGLFKAWDFTRALYDDVLKPAWTKFWSLVDRVKATLEHVFRPVIEFLRHVREEILGFYTKWVRPVLDTIGVTRKLLRVLSALHLDFAKKLDAKLGDLEAAIDRPFRELLARVNEVINWVDRIVTADGLFQRLTLVRSITRDFAVIGEEYGRWHKKPLTDEERARLAARTVPGDEPSYAGSELAKFYRGEKSAFAGIINELVPEWREAAGLSRSGAP